MSRVKIAILRTTILALLLSSGGWLLLHASRSSAAAGVNVLTFNNTNERVGANVNETSLTPSNVNVNSFGKLGSVSVDGYVFAQPLYASNVNIGGQTHNVFFVVTAHDGAYAFDADSLQQLWYTSFVNPGEGITSVSTSDVGNCGNIFPEIGITGTPVIDPGTMSIYFVTKTKENGVIYQRLHALNATTGVEQPGSPVVIQATVPGTGDGSVNGEVSFNATKENQRPSLLLQHGVVEIGWASHCDFGPYHAWVMAYSAKTLQQRAVWNSTPDGGLGGIWQAGDGLAADADFNTYFATGNGTFDRSSGGRDMGDSIVKLPPSKKLSGADYFTPYNQAHLSAMDLDLGSGGVVLFNNPEGPVKHLLVGAGKEGSIYLINRDNMGQYNPSNNNQIVQFIPYVMGGIWGSPVVWNRNLYFAGSHDAVKQFAFTPSTGLLSTSPISKTPTTFGFPNAEVAVSSDGPSNGILWVFDSSKYYSNGAAVLHAYDATNLATEFYNTTQNSNRDNPGNAVEFSVPTVANGKVYVGAEKQVSIFGLLQ